MEQNEQNQGLFLSFEGIDGSGKSTQAKLLFEKLTQNNIPSLYTKEPTDLPIGQMIRNLFSKKESQIEKHAQIFLFMADRVQHCQEILLPALKAKKIVICDRYFDSTLAYQGLDLPLQQWIQKISPPFLPKPALTFFLDCPPEVAFQRLTDRNAKTKQAKSYFEERGVKFLQDVQAAYLKIYQQEKKRILRIPANQNPTSIEQKIWSHLLQKHPQFFLQSA